MTIKLNRAWTDDAGKQHENGAVLDLDHNAELALCNGGIAVKTAPVKKPASAPITKDEPVETDDERKVRIRQEIIDLGGDAPHPNTGIAKLEEALADLKIDPAGSSNDTLEAGASNDSVTAETGNDSVTG